MSDLTHTHLLYTIMHHTHLYSNCVYFVQNSIVIIFRTARQNFSINFFLTRQIELLYQDAAASIIFDLSSKVADYVATIHKINVLVQL